MNGTQILINQLLKSLGLNPETFQKMAGDIGQTVLGFKAQLDRIEANQEAIMRRLEIGPESAEAIYLEKKDAVK